MNAVTEIPPSSAPATGGCWPNEQQELLLKAALLEGEAARAAWMSWRAKASLNKLDTASHRLLPLVYHNLRTLQIDDPLMPEMEGVHRYFWLRNQVLFNQAANVLRSLHAAGIPTLLLKGVALIVRQEQDPGLRPMEDFDFLVPVARVGDALPLLAAAGWRPLQPVDLRPEMLDQQHSADLKHESGINLDLHWHVLHGCTAADADDDFWAAAVEFRLQEVPTAVLSPADQLLHLCAHGVRWEQMPPIRWVADALLLLRAAPNLDWDRLRAQTEKRRLVPRMRDALNYLVRVFAAPVPERVLQHLRTTPVSAAEEADHARITHPPSLPTLTDALRYHFAACRRKAGVAWRVGVLAYFQEVWKVKHRWQVPFVAVFRALRNIARRLTQGGRSRNAIRHPGD